MAKLDGRADLWPMMSGDLQANISINAAFERVRFENPADSKYMSTNFPEGRRLDRNVGFDNAWTYEKRTELSFGGAVSGDGVTKTTTKRVSLGQWTAGDQLRFGVFGATSETKRPTDSFLDYDSETIDLKGRVISQTVGTAIKAILNPSTIVTAEVSSVRSTERPNLHAWAAGIRQFVSPCDCAFHGDVSRAVNLGKLDTNMANGELTGLQWTILARAIQGHWHGPQEDSRGMLSHSGDWERDHHSSNLLCTAGMVVGFLNAAASYATSMGRRCAQQHACRSV
jgi:hypothetical protein